MTRTPPRDDVDNIEAEEREILEGFRRVCRSTLFAAVDSVALVGTYPETIIRVTASKHGQTRTHDWSVWDGTMTGAPAGIGSGPEAYRQLFEVQVMYWLTAPYWKEPLSGVDAAISGEDRPATAEDEKS